jgi:hypothetical protein
MVTRHQAAFHDSSAYGEHHAVTAHTAALVLTTYKRRPASRIRICADLDQKIRSGAGRLDVTDGPSRPLPLQPMRSRFGPSL